jgi:hypothetical protein
VATAANTIVEFAEQFVEQVIAPICNAMQEAYKEAGSPFGDTQEGLLMWMEVMSLANRREQEREARQMRHELMLDAVRLGEEIRRGNDGQNLP